MKDSKVRTCTLCAQTKPWVKFAPNQVYCLACRALRERAGVKECIRCKKLQALSEFHTSKVNRDNLHNACKLCEKLRKQKDYQARRALVLAQRQTVEGRYATYRHSAAAKKRSFTLSLQEFADLTQKPCVYCGGFSPGKQHNGIDRIDSALGYTKDNTQTCCSVCNTAKRDYSHAEFMAYLLRVANHLLSA